MSEPEEKYGVQKGYSKNTQTQKKENFSDPGNLRKTQSH